MRKESSFLKLRNKLMPVAGAMYLTLMTATQVYADTGVAKVDAGLKTIKNLACGIVGAIGVIVLIKGIYDIGVAISQRDISGVSTAAGELGGGLLMASITAVVALFA